MNKNNNNESTSINSFASQNPKNWINQNNQSPIVNYSNISSIYKPSHNNNLTVVNNNYNNNISKNPNIFPQ
jgi:hypothetical protein